jgi:hypothetical protein
MCVRSYTMSSLSCLGYGALSTGACVKSRSTSRGSVRGRCVKYGDVRVWTRGKFEVCSRGNQEAGRVVELGTVHVCRFDKGRSWRAGAIPANLGRVENKSSGACLRTCYSALLLFPQSRLECREQILRCFRISWAVREQGAHPMRSEPKVRPSPSPAGVTGA